MRKIIQLALMVTASSAALLSLSGCNDIPGEYQGTFVDATTGSTLSLSSSGAQFTDNTGRTIKGDVDKVDLESLAQGKAGLYTRASSKNEQEIELIWAIPDVSTRQETSQYVWFTRVEFLYLRMRMDLKSAVSSVPAAHCKDGVLMLDQPTQTWNGGCPPTGQTLKFQRKAQ